MLEAVRRGAFADQALERHAAALTAADRRLAQELAYGVLRLRGRLDHILDRLVDGGVGRLDPEVLDALRLGAYQLLELDRVPAYAAVSQAVESVKRGASRRAGAAALVNAVLRRLGDGSYESFAFPDPDRDHVGWLASWGSHPRWLVERWLERWPAEEVDRLVDYNNRRPGVYLTAIHDREEALARLAEAGIAGRAADGSIHSVEIDPGNVVAALDRVAAVVQDPAAATVVDYMGLDPGVPVADLCAAPGGKAALLASRGHAVRAFDVSATRLERLRSNRSRLGLEEMQIVVADATRPPLSRAPIVLLDVPCTGTGTLARHPDARWRLDRSNLEALIDLQRRLLDSAARLIEPGGLLVYATCSLEPEENEGQVEEFLARQRAFELEPPPASAVADELLGSRGELRVLPQRHEMDGAYAARLRRRAG
ncbi:MAG: 16S rRNA (cytosine(967)-C(5))-methyltransferase RsmB [Gemmatimonadetes bacterium]|uniref:16S rRNA (Cytosine(967)-C(5))-methyltransferase RsmB n=1 Tax=Candidatus Kutchimonas denitrificans TaxID=3056748 RepID=A0AAE5CDC6_9BACT|nr:16S rRNA (cytosine(967)-C(5))-methyltransferase RsmB [Gemmatimonadota bacterium]NIR75524.1 16S rRNA (cytosine(967)-C(5))-methyltransferase RsmB [Candidatus Kutchimonas denitrificans]NIS01838.1 16S rRNA (cytosine(967)-C(5))-methyltransferase RsmB [Gemmatimonadota bacterium]NIT67619.1 16S rRNA (cytosine(967)-C(5))-methyltransferase RsmB [Gemmatimonadota bacterium]NIU53493.1 16S rRNA (cytosine(967)-C(5))-methyltransferase RsmB [Gemmatimonadota bacterium]